MTIPTPPYRALEIDVPEFQPLGILQTVADPGETRITLLAAA